MTRTEVKELLINRLEFKVAGATPLSGQYFEGEHAIVTLENIKSCQPNISISQLDFDVFLLELKTSVIFKVLTDVFDKDDISSDILLLYPALFDTLISMQMTVMVINLIVTSTRINTVQRITNDAVQMIHFDLNGNYGQGANPKFPHSYGIAYRYKEELRRVQNNSSNQRKLTSITSI